MPRGTFDSKAVATAMAKSAPITCNCRARAHYDERHDGYNLDPRVEPLQQAFFLREFSASKLRCSVTTNDERLRSMTPRASPLNGEALVAPFPVAENRPIRTEDPENQAAAEHSRQHVTEYGTTHERRRIWGNGRSILTKPY